MSIPHVPRSAAPEREPARPFPLVGPRAMPTTAPHEGTEPRRSGRPATRPVRLQVFSDLHADVADGRDVVIAPDVDAVVVAGDTCRGPAKAFAYLRKVVPSRIPIVAVLGNHEHYRAFVPETLEAARRAAAEHDVEFLEDTTTTFAGVRYVGCTLWTDYALYGADKAVKAMATAAECMNDHRLIGLTREPWRSFGPADAAVVHRASRGFLERVLATPFDGGPTIVVTHHAPHARSIHPRYEHDNLNAAFASDLGGVIEAGKPALWVHGHVHSNFDYRIGDTRVVCNPRGYGAENPDFDPCLVVEVPR